ncbi:uncharacterized protein LOC128392143 [Panonychus citri]|uniref:uncharacterized protein LOC128392143 n=1 Tax=Panonychus citri TaxID=50023 RepID=UPI0023075D26|nr:uncharacterized protein LOC128392143 [Panonychus citri]
MKKPPINKMIIAISKLLICLITLSSVTSIPLDLNNDDQVNGYLKQLITKELTKLESSGWKSQDPLLNNVIIKATDLVENGPEIVWFEDENVLDNVISNLRNYLTFLKESGFNPDGSIVDNVNILSKLIVNNQDELSPDITSQLESKLEQLILKGFKDFQSPDFDVNKSLIENLSKLLVKSVSSNAYKTDLPIFESFNIAHAYQWISLHNQLAMDPTAETISQIVLSTLISIYFPGYSPGLSLDKIVYKFIKV